MFTKSGFWKYWSTMLQEGQGTYKNFHQLRVRSEKLFDYETTNECQLCNFS